MCSCPDATLGTAPALLFRPEQGAAPGRPAPPLWAGCQGGSRHTSKLKAASLPHPSPPLCPSDASQEATGKAPCALCPLAGADWDQRKICAVHPSDTERSEPECVL